MTPTVKYLVTPAVKYLLTTAVKYFVTPAVKRPKDPVSVSHEYEAASNVPCEHHFDRCDKLNRKMFFKS